MELRNDMGTELSSKQGKGDPGSGDCSCPAVETCEPGVLERAEYKVSEYKGHMKLARQAGARSCGAFEG